jgi:hypothetical protein
MRRKVPRESRNDAINPVQIGMLQVDLGRTASCRTRWPRTCNGSQDPVGSLHWGTTFFQGCLKCFSLAGDGGILWIDHRSRLRRFDERLAIDAQALLD